MTLYFQRKEHNTSKCCFNPYHTTKTESELVSEHMINRDPNAKTHEEVASAKNIQTKRCNEKWNQHLIDVARYMKTVELLEGLGRRSTCLRGCVAEDSVICIFDLSALEQ